jgi:hypothetical protein
VLVSPEKIFVSPLGFHLRVADEGNMLPRSDVDIQLSDFQNVDIMTENEEFV